MGRESGQIFNGVTNDLRHQFCGGLREPTLSGVGSLIVSNRRKLK